MNPSDENKSFLDRGTIIAIVLVMGFWFAWSRFMETRYPTKPMGVDSPASPSTESQPAGVAASQDSVSGAKQSGAPTQAASQEAMVVEEKVFEFDGAELKLQLSSRGMGLKNITLKAYQSRTNEPIVLGATEKQLPFSTYLVGESTPINFAVEQSAADTFVGRATVNGMTIQKTMRIDSAHYAVITEVSVNEAPEGFKGLETILSDAVGAQAESSVLSSSSYEHQNFVYLHEGSKSQQVIDLKKGLQVSEKNVNVAALSSHYFTLAVVDRSPLMPRFETDVPIGASVAIGKLIYQPVSASKEFKVQFAGFTGPKSLAALNDVDPQLAKVIDYGMFAWIAKPLLWLLKFLNSFIHNFGWSIVVLTVIVRFVVLPFNVYSYRSMKVMQKIQPEMQRLRERYKEDPQTMNREVMALMKRNKANPLGGCIPMLLQLPIFFALYQVLGQSIELYRAPFMLWIHDLSSKDPFYVLPVLMGVTMFIQQKITPSTMDPAQAKIMMWMPVIFSFFMISLPSGLTLYIFVSTLFGIVQQYMFMKERTSENPIPQVQV